MLPLSAAAAPMEGRRTLGRAAAEKAAAANAAAGHVPQLSQPGEAETEDEDMNNEPSRRPVTASVLKGIMTIRSELGLEQDDWQSCWAGACPANFLLSLCFLLL